MDYGKFRYEQSKRDKEARKKQKVITVKEVKMRTESRNMTSWSSQRNARKFLDAGDKVKVTIMFKGVRFPMLISEKTCVINWPKN